MVLNETALNEFKIRIGEMWHKSRQGASPDYLRLEMFLADLLKSDIPVQSKFAAIKEALDATTRRSFFREDQYLRDKY